ncbi:hypothetical protein BSPWISOXPB_5010 [uncultured Gammaproteobacteria bacterium]|nr:hypothetical protein BSPWISOXPB_5010 [uncultured Gammaproteobacteria bacterium]
MNKALWQVDLGSKKDIKQIIIYNRTDCCAARLSNYQVSISNKADFSTHTYQQDFHVAPNPKKIIQLDASGKQGRYVRIQLLDSDYLSLAEVQVMGVDPLRFAEVDFSSALNNFGGWHYDAPNYPNFAAFAALKPMAQSRRGVIRMLEAQVRLLVVGFIQMGRLCRP